MRRALDGLLSITLPSLSVAAENADRGSRERRELWPDRSDLSEKKSPSTYSLRSVPRVTDIHVFSNYRTLLWS